MLSLSNLFIIGGIGRNVGKTEFACRVIRAFSGRYDVYALKVSAIYPDEDIFHGNHASDDTITPLFEETREDTHKDTSRMLKAGAKRVFYLRGDDKQILPALTKFLTLIPQHAPIVCESNSLWQFVESGLFTAITKEGTPVKPRSKILLEHVDMIISSDGENGFSGIERIDFQNHSWSISPKR